MLALVILVVQFEKGDDATRKRIYDLYLKKHCRAMPRTMLRYAIERFPEKKRLRYLSGTVRGAKRSSGQRSEAQ